ncbi:unnamed protein product [Ixodes persulcatus]
MNRGSHQLHKNFNGDAQSSFFFFSENGKKKQLFTLLLRKLGLNERFRRASPQSKRKATFKKVVLSSYHIICITIKLPLYLFWPSPVCPYPSRLATRLSMEARIFPGCPPFL